MIGHLGILNSAPAQAPCSCDPLMFARGLQRPGIRIKSMQVCRRAISTVAMPSVSDRLSAYPPSERINSRLAIGPKIHLGSRLLFELGECGFRLVLFSGPVQGHAERVQDRSGGGDPVLLLEQSNSVAGAGSAWRGEPLWKWYSH